jgi:hypothetical protein
MLLFIVSKIKKELDFSGRERQDSRATIPYGILCGIPG